MAEPNATTRAAMVEARAISRQRERGYTLDELLAQCDSAAPPPKDLEAWEPSAPSNEVQKGNQDE
jgi:hypothetical protein